MVKSVYHPEATSAFGVGTRSAETEAFRRAGLLDLPFIFYLIFDGSVEGAFSERFLSGKGHVNLFIVLFANIVPFGKYFFGTLKRYEFFVFQKGQDGIGCVGISTVPSTSDVVIRFFAIGHEHRAKGNGALMMRRFIEHLPADATVSAYTAKYAAAMQRVLTRTGFKRAHPSNSDMKLFILARPKQN